MNSTRVFRWIAVLFPFGFAAATADERSDAIRLKYGKFEQRIAMRDGKKLFTAIYVPNDANVERSYPMLLVRTPYSVGPYGVDQYRSTLGPSEEFEKSGYIFVFQDVRGKFMSEGEFVDMRPQRTAHGPMDVDESTDTFDTIEWLVKNIDHNNGRVGQWGVSYPGFYASAGAVSSHPALKAVSPQAPIADWFFDDFHRNGAFILPMGVNFFASFGQSRPDPTTVSVERMIHGTKDGYQFFLELGSLKHVNEKHFHDKIAFWNDIVAHPNYDEFWKARNLLPHLKNITASVLVVGGWFDTEDLYGPLATYQSIESQNPGTANRLVMGPWHHGGWNGGDGQKLGQADFGFATAKWFREQVQFPFFEHHLKEKGTLPLAEAVMFETGANRWREFASWPPKDTNRKSLWFGSNNMLAEANVNGSAGQASPSTGRIGQTEADASLYDEFVSDPSKPVPYTMEITTNWSRDYMTEDQRFAAWRPDVLVYRSASLKDDVTIAGPVTADLWVSTSQSDTDWIVKIVDEFPSAPPQGAKPNDPAWEAFPSGRQQLVRAGVMRGRFRDSFEAPEPFQPDQPTRVKFELSDILHNFRSGHRLMIQVQSTWFPFVDRNPQKYVPNIFQANDDDFVKATHRLHRSAPYASRIEFSTIVGKNP